MIEPYRAIQPTCLLLAACASVAVCGRPAFATTPPTHAGGLTTFTFEIPFSSVSPDPNTISAYCTIGGVAPTTSAPVAAGSIVAATPGNTAYGHGHAAFSFTTASESAATGNTYTCVVTATDSVIPSIKRTFRIGGTWDDTAGTTSGIGFKIPAPPRGTATPAPTPTPTPLVTPTPVPTVKYSISLLAVFQTVEIGATYSAHCVTTWPGTSNPTLTADSGKFTTTAESFGTNIGVAFFIPTSLATTTNPQVQCFIRLTPVNPAVRFAQDVSGIPNTFGLARSSSDTTVVNSTRMVETEGVH